MRKTFTIYDVATGLIERVEYRPAAPNVPAGKSLIEGEFDPDVTFIFDGSAYALPSKPSEHHTFDPAVGAWFDPRDSAEIAEDESAENEAAIRAYHSDVNRERAHRIRAGTSVQVTGHTEPINLDGRDEDLRNLQALAFAAQLRLGQGDNAHETVFRDGANVDHTLIPEQVIELWSVGASWVEATYQASWQIKTMPMDTDVSDDSLWP